MRQVILLEPGDVPKKGDLGFCDKLGTWCTSEQRWLEQRNGRKAVSSKEKQDQELYRIRWGVANGRYNGSVAFIRLQEKAEGYEETLTQFGIEIVEDGTLLKKYRRFSYFGYDLDVDHATMLKMVKDPGALSKLVFQVGEASRSAEIKSLIEPARGLKLLDES